MWFKPKQMTTKLWQIIDAVFFGNIFLMGKANKLLHLKIKECTIAQFEKDKRLSHSEDRLHRVLASSVELVHKIEDKATKTLIGIAIAVSVISIASGIVDDGGTLSELTITNLSLTGLLLIVTLVYLFGSGFLALQAYKIGEIYHPTLYDYVPLVEPKEQAAVMLFCIEQNQSTAIMRSNQLSASFCLLRNGIIALIIFGITIIVLR